ncbi:hypothetical protein GL50803_0022027 [Giardia duodenalis]|uniref:Uncharacterized protein n=1 Tax=Giardia intestinalis (strain ATCC 50803 / WB clone C6) TaxID=184922 RepID=D3KGA3_GIAIC|nr:hypothetical protein GL50803_0022027 [Giardia intestinalis]KAE8303866.1 hypothetical protein GL50803_0022027 [Giardia intestinalis]
MHQILQSSLSFFEDGAQAERKLLSLISAFTEMISRLDDPSDVYETTITCASLFFQLPCPNAGRALVDLILAPLLQRVQFTRDYATWINASVRDGLACNLKQPANRFRFLDPDNVFDILILAATQAISDKIINKKRDLFKICDIPPENRIVIIYFYGVLFSKSTFLRGVCKQSSPQLSEQLTTIYNTTYVRGLQQMLTKSCEVIEAIRGTVARLFYHMALLNIDMISTVLSLNPLMNLLHSMQSRCGGSAPSHRGDLEALSVLCKDICVYAQSCPASLLSAVRDRYVSYFSSIPFTSVPPPLRPFLLDDSGPLYPAIVIRGDDEDESAYRVRLFAPSDVISNLQTSPFQAQGEQLYTSIMGQYSFLIHSRPFPTIASMPQILPSARSPEGAPLGLFTAAILGEARAFTS